MRATYDSGMGVLTIALSSARIEGSDEEKPGVILDCDRDGNVVGLGVFGASSRAEDLSSFECAVLSA